MKTNTNQHSACYGNMVPDFEHLNINKPTDGKAIRVLVEKIGVATQRRTFEVKPEEWEGCIACPDYRTCYDLSLAKLALYGALAGC